MRGLTLIVVGDDRQRFDAALTIACAQAAIGGRVRLYCHGPAVACLTTSDLMDTARDLGVALIACQTGLAELGLALPEGVAGDGLVGLLSDLGDDRLATL